MGANVGVEVPEEEWAKDPAKRLSVYLNHVADSEVRKVGESVHMEG